VSKSAKVVLGRPARYVETSERASCVRPEQGSKSARLAEATLFAIKEFAIMPKADFGGLGSAQMQAGNR